MRTCTYCPRSFLKDDVRHLHELEKGDRFRIDGTQEVRTLLWKTESRCGVSTPKKDTRVAFQDGDEHVEFWASGSKEKICSPMTMVRLLTKPKIHPAKKRASR